MNRETVEMVVTFVVLAAVFATFVREWLPVDMAALGGMCLLLAAGIIDEQDLGKVFSNPAPMTIGAMFVLSEALTRTGAIDWLARKFALWSGKSAGRALLIMALIVMPLSSITRRSWSSSCRY